VYIFSLLLIGKTSTIGNASLESKVISHWIVRERRRRADGGWNRSRQRGRGWCMSSSCEL